MRRLAVSAVAALTLVVTPGSGASGAGVSFVAIDGGDESYCALTTAGGVFCWGWNGWGNAGDGTHVDRGRPVPVLGLSGGVKAVSADRNHACALLRAGTVECWGANYWGQLGDGTMNNSSRPVQVVGLSGVVAITTSGEDSCALTSGGGVKCWGGNNPIGDWPDRHNSRPTPVDLGGFSSAVTAMAGGDLIELCALTVAGAVQCWGGWDGPGRVVPSFASGVAAISIGGWYSGRICAVTTGGALACEGSSGAANAPSSGVKAVSVGATGGVCYLTTAGEAFCAGALGGGGQDATLRPVAGISGATAIAVGGSNACAIVAGGAIKCWGYNSYGALGCGCTSTSYTPPTAVAVPSSPAGGTSGGTTSGCSRASANAAVARYRLGDPGVPNPVFKALCGSFTGAGSRTMVASLSGPGNTGMIAWVVFRWSGGAWTFLLKQHRAAQLSAAGADIRETVSVYRAGDPRCCPSGGTKSRLWHWNGARLVAAPRK